MRAAEKAAAGQGVLIVDDTILAKPHSDESELVGWHFDHSGRENAQYDGFHIARLPPR